MVQGVIKWLDENNWKFNSTMKKGELVDKYSICYACAPRKTKTKEDLFNSITKYAIRQ